jgi:hypothetical protein
MSNDTNDPDGVYSGDILYTSPEDERVSLFIKNSYTISDEPYSCNYLNSDTGSKDETISNRRFTMRRGKNTNNPNEIWRGHVYRDMKDTEFKQLLESEEADTKARTSDFLSSREGVVKVGPIGGYDYAVCGEAHSDNVHGRESINKRYHYTDVPGNPFIGDCIGLNQTEFKKVKRDCKSTEQLKSEGEFIMCPPKLTENKQECKFITCSGSGENDKVNLDLLQCVDKKENKSLYTIPTKETGERHWKCLPHEENTEEYQCPPQNIVNQSINALMKHPTKGVNDEDIQWDKETYNQRETMFLRNMDECYNFGGDETNKAITGDDTGGEHLFGNKKEERDIRNTATYGWHNLTGQGFKKINSRNTWVHQGKGSFERGQPVWVLVIPPKDGTVATNLREINARWIQGEIMSKDGEKYRVELFPSEVKGKVFTKTSRRPIPNNENILRNVSSDRLRPRDLPTGKKSPLDQIWLHSICGISGNNIADGYIDTGDKVPKFHLGCYDGEQMGEYGGERGFDHNIDMHYTCAEKEKALSMFPALGHLRKKHGHPRERDICGISEDYGSALNRWAEWCHKYKKRGEKGIARNYSPYARNGNANNASLTHYFWSGETNECAGPHEKYRRWNKDKWNDIPRGLSNKQKRDIKIARSVGHSTGWFTLGIGHAAAEATVAAIKANPKGGPLREENDNKGGLITYNDVQEDWGSWGGVYPHTTPNSESFGTKNGYGWGWIEGSSHGPSWNYDTYWHSQSPISLMGRESEKEIIEGGGILDESGWRKREKETWNTIDETKSDWETGKSNLKRHENVGLTSCKNPDVGNGGKFPDLKQDTLLFETNNESNALYPTQLSQTTGDKNLLGEDKSVSKGGMYRACSRQKEDYDGKNMLNCCLHGKPLSPQKMGVKNVSSFSCPSDYCQTPIPESSGRCGKGTTVSGNSGEYCIEMSEKCYKHGKKMCQSKEIDNDEELDRLCSLWGGIFTKDMKSFYGKKCLWMFDKNNKDVRKIMDIKRKEDIGRAKNSFHQLYKTLGNSIICSDSIRREMGLSKSRENLRKGLCKDTVSKSYGRCIPIPKGKCISIQDDRNKKQFCRDLETKSDYNQQTCESEKNPDGTSICRYTSEPPPPPNTCRPKSGNESSENPCSRYNGYSKKQCESDKKCVYVRPNIDLSNDYDICRNQKDDPEECEKNPKCFWETRYKGNTMKQTDPDAREYWKKTLKGSLLSSKISDLEHLKQANKVSIPGKTDAVDGFGFDICGCHYGEEYNRWYKANKVPGIDKGESNKMLVGQPHHCWMKDCSDSSWFIPGETLQSQCKNVFNCIQNNFANVYTKGRLSKSNKIQGKQSCILNFRSTSVDTSQLDKLDDTTKEIVSQAVVDAIKNDNKNETSSDPSGDDDVSDDDDDSSPLMAPTNEELEDEQEEDEPQDYTLIKVIIAMIIVIMLVSVTVYLM